jgi:hypothetical protein
MYRRTLLARQSYTPLVLSSTAKPYGKEIRRFDKEPSVPVTRKRALLNQANFLTLFCHALPANGRKGMEARVQ